MSNTLLNISGKLDSQSIALFDYIGAITAQLNIPYMVVGAYARDLVLHHGYDAIIQRATTDIDLGIRVPNWAVFEQLKEQLLQKGFQTTANEHRLVSPENRQVDIVPFGQVADDNTNIQWPPNGDIELTVLGFQEAHDHAEIVRIQNEPPIDIPVATPKGMMILKVISWTDRTPGMRKKDAKDLRYLMANYEKIPAIRDALYEDATLMEQYGWDIELAGAYQLGVDAKAIAGTQTHQVINDLFRGAGALPVERLIEEMCDHYESEYVRNEKLTNAMIAGFLQGNNQ